MYDVQSPRTDDEGIEHTLARNARAPRISLADVEANITTENYFTAADGVAGCNSRNTLVQQPSNPRHNLLTFCVLVLRNGFTAVGQSACVSAENFDPESGRSIARTEAINQVWRLMGYELLSKLALVEQGMANLPRRLLSDEEVEAIVQTHLLPDAPCSVD